MTVAAQLLGRLKCSECTPVTLNALVFAVPVEVSSWNVSPAQAAPFQYCHVLDVPAAYVAAAPMSNTTLVKTFLSSSGPSAVSTAPIYRQSLLAGAAGKSAAGRAAVMMLAE